MSAFIRRPGRRHHIAASAIGAVVLASGLAGCAGAADGAGHSTTTPSGTTSSRSTRPTPPPSSTSSDAGPVPRDTVEVSGAVFTDDGDPESLAVVTLVSDDTGEETTATTDDDGSWSARVAPGGYELSCTSFDGACLPDDAPGDDVVDVDVDGMTSVDFTVTTGGGGSSPSPTQGRTGGGDLAQACRDEGYSVCGRVTQGGRPVAGVVIEAKTSFSPSGQNQVVETNDQGVYGLTLQLPVANLLCEETDAMLSSNLVCSAAGGDGGPVVVSSDDHGRIVDFVVEPL